MGSGGIESANKFICHVRLKRSGAWWYERTSNQMLALRCAKYNGTFERNRLAPYQRAVYMLAHLGYGCRGWGALLPLPRKLADRWD